MIHLLRKVTVPFLSASFLTACAAQGSIRCQKPEFSETVKIEKLYHFQGTIRCEIFPDHDSELVHVSGLKDRFVDSWEKDEDFKIFSVSEVRDCQSLPTLRVDLSESYDSGHGKIKIFSEALIVENSQNSLQIDFTFKQIKAKSDARYTRHEEKSVYYRRLSGTEGVMVVKKLVKVKKPALAPSSFFKTQTEKGIGKNLRYIAEKYARATLSR